MGRCIGIDLGTTNSVMAIAEMGGCRVLHKENEQQMRSIVGLYKGEFLIGRTALNRWELSPEDTIFSIKRLMGRAVSDPEVEKVKQDKWIQFKIVEPSDGTRDSVRVILGGKEYSPVAISAMILRRLKEDAEFILGEKVTHAVITVPAYFSDKQRHATSEAGSQAGIIVMRIFDEPTAAAIAFGIDSKDQEPKTILVYDLGGGTFDISVLLMGAGSFAPLNLEGDMWLGGDNFDQTIIDYVEGYVKKEYKIDPTNNKRFMVKLRLEVQKAKEALSFARATDLIVSGLLHDDNGNIIDVEIEITRDHFEDMIRPLVDKTISLVRKAVENANLTFNDIDYVLLAGNASSVPMVQESLERLFGKEKILRKVHPKNCVAIGAALRAAAISSNQDMNIGNIAPFPYGIQTEGDKFNVFIGKSDGVPTPEDKKVIQNFYTQFPNQRIISLPVYGGNELESASKNDKQGEAFAILPPFCPQGTPIRIKLWLDQEGIFQLTANMEDGTNIEPRILRGEVDQKAAEILYKSEEAIARNEDALSPEVRREAERLQNEVLNEIQKKEFGKAEKKAEDLLKFIEDKSKEGDPLRGQAEGLIGYAKYIVNSYSWLIGQDAIYNLNNLIGELQEAVDKNDRSRLENSIRDINVEIGKYMETQDSAGKREPTLLAVFVGLHGRIMSDINLVEPAKANNLRQELYDIEEAFKNRNNNAMDRLNAFITKFLSVVEDIEKRPGAKGTRECKLCGHENPKGIRYCENCKADLWILSHEKASTPSTGNIKRW